MCASTLKVDQCFVSTFAVSPQLFVEGGEVLIGVGELFEQCVEIGFCSRTRPVAIDVWLSLSESSAGKCDGTGDANSDQCAAGRLDVGCPRLLLSTYAKMSTVFFPEHGPHSPRMWHFPLM